MSDMIPKYKLKNISPRKLLVPPNGEKNEEGKLRESPSPDDKEQLKLQAKNYNLNDFFNNNYDDAKLMASITNSFSDINDTPDKWDTMYRMITSKQGYSTMLIKQRINNSENNYKFPFIYIK